VEKYPEFWDVRCAGARDRRVMTTYVFNQGWRREYERLVALEDLFDEATTRRLAAIGVGQGWQCLEVGAGAGGVARWLAKRVGPTGNVVATDVDTRFLRGHGKDNLDVWEHNIVDGPLPEAAFDLVHARCLVEHVPHRDRVLRRLRSAVRPGGWLIVEDADMTATSIAGMNRYLEPADAAPLVERVTGAIRAVFTAAGADPTFGDQLPSRLLKAGLVKVAAQVSAPVVKGGADRALIPLSLNQLRPVLLGEGLLSEEDFRAVLDLCAAPTTRYVPLILVAAWGQRPHVEPERVP
jgi:2-polyprenyl-3-methyl-5-hydroxy-6-metoxy-1,4-benzoquinol methylase